jgi:TRAP-type mannitol/chloroaromatic compound transport system permease small subunit
MDLRDSRAFSTPYDFSSIAEWLAFAFVNLWKKNVFNYSFDLSQKLILEASWKQFTTIFPLS